MLYVILKKALFFRFLCLATVQGNAGFFCDQNQGYDTSLGCLCIIQWFDTSITTKKDRLMIA